MVLSPSERTQIVAPYAVCRAVSSMWSAALKVRGDVTAPDDALAFLVGGCVLLSEGPLLACDGCCSLEGAGAPVKVIPKRLIETLVDWDGWSWLIGSHKIVESNQFCNRCFGLGSLDVLLVVKNCTSV
jgi:hypothetical protein